LGHFKKSNTKPLKKLIEFKNFQEDYNKNLFLGKEINIKDVFNEGDLINISGTSKGKGFQGVVKRHNFKGVGDATHGQHNRQRAPGSIGGCSYPARVFKGMRMAGRMGGAKVKILNLKILKIIFEENIIVVNGCIPGSKNSYIILEK
jgi:large subunit ribosomal protein L3